MHELGHKKYNDAIKHIANKRKISYSKAKEMVDGIVNSMDIADINELSKHSIESLMRGKVGEVFAESYSARKGSNTAKIILRKLGDLL